MSRLVLGLGLGNVGSFWRWQEWETGKS